MTATARALPVSLTEVPFLDLPAQHRPLRQKILEVWGRLLDDAAFVGGPEVEAFEREFAAAVGARRAVSVASGTDALRFIFLGLGIRPGDEIITVPNTFIATLEAIVQSGATVRFVDVDPRTATMDPAQLDRAITPRTVGIVPVHLYGQTADMTAIGEIARRRGLWVVEDACQAHLARHQNRIAGTLGVAAAFSFYPGKNLGACGEAGAVTTDDADLANRIQMWRDHGQRTKYHHDFSGYNGRCDALQAAALRIKLPHLVHWNEERRSVADRYLRRLDGLPGLTLPYTAPGNEHVFHLFVVRTAGRDRLADQLRERRIGTGLHYPKPLHLQTACADLGLTTGAFPVAEAWSSTCLSLPMYPGLTDDQVDAVCDSVIDLLGRHAG